MSVRIEDDKPKSRRNECKDRRMSLSIVDDL